MAKDTSLSALAKRALSTVGVGDAYIDTYRRARRVRRARSFLESGYVFSESIDAILADFGAVCLSTQLSMAGVANLEAMARHVVANRLRGAFVECGTWRGGATGYWARSFLRNGGDPREASIWGFDSFEGMPGMTAEDGEATAHWLHGSSMFALPPEKLAGERRGDTGLNVAAESDVWEMLTGAGYPRDRLHVVKGWFQDTLPVHAGAIGPIAVLRLDGDFYESTRVCMQHLFDHVVPGGVVIIDDYGTFPGCRRAIDEFVGARGIAAPLHYVDVGVRYFFKA